MFALPSNDTPPIVLDVVNPSALPAVSALPVTLPTMLPVMSPNTGPLNDVAVTTPIKVACPFVSIVTPDPT